MATQKEIIEQEAKALEMAYNSLVDFRRIYMPAPDESDPAPFHHQWSDILLRGKKHFAVEAFRESAKALALDTPILTTNGWKTMGTILVGDYVYSLTGLPVGEYT